MSDEINKKPQSESESEREQSLENIIGDFIEIPMFILAIIMLILLIIDLAFNLSAEWRRTVWLINTIIWWIFIAEFAFRVFVADNRLSYIRNHLLDALFIFVPFLRVFRIFRVIRSIRLLRVVHPAILGRTFVTTRRGLRQLARVLGDRSFPYVLATTLIVVLISALVMYLLERNAGGSVITSYGDAIWWTIGVVTTVGNELYPITSEGRVVATILMIYGVGVFGYIAATLASYFIESDKNRRPEDAAEVRLVNDQAERLREISSKLDELSARRSTEDNNPDK